MNSLKKNDRIAFIDALKALACLLIINSHCSDLYPSSLMALGGGQGNAIFLIVTGFLCADIKLPWWKWIAKRYCRLIPVTLMICVTDLMICALLGTPQTNIIFYCINSYWFVWALAIYYIPYYLIFKSKEKTRIKLLSMAYLTGYVLLYILQMNESALFVEAEGFSLFKVYFYFAPMILGGVIAYFVFGEKDRCSDSVIKTRLARPGVLMIAAIIGLSAWGLEYACVTLFRTAFKWQFIINIGNIVFCVCLFCALLAGFNSHSVEKLGQSKLMKMLSMCTLEIYLVQILIKRFFPSLGFPANAILYFVLSIGLGVTLHKTSKGIPKLMTGNKFRITIGKPSGNRRKVK